MKTRTMYTFFAFYFSSIQIKLIAVCTPTDELSVKIEQSHCDSRKKRQTLLYCMNESEQIVHFKYQKCMWLIQHSVFPTGLDLLSSMIRNKKMCCSSKQINFRFSVANELTKIETLIFNHSV